MGAPNSLLPPWLVALSGTACGPWKDSDLSAILNRLPVKNKKCCLLNEAHGCSSRLEGTQGLQIRYPPPPHLCEKIGTGWEHLGGLPCGKSLELGFEIGFI